MKLCAGGANSRQLSGIWADELQEGDASKAQRFDISKGLTRAALDIIGESKSSPTPSCSMMNSLSAVFDYHFGSLNDADQNEFSRILSNLLSVLAQYATTLLISYSADSTVHPPAAAILFTGTWAFIPESILQFVAYLPARQFVRFREFLTIGKRLGKDLIDGKDNLGVERKKNDILSILGKPDLVCFPGTALTFS